MKGMGAPTKKKEVIRGEDGVYSIMHNNLHATPWKWGRIETSLSLPIVQYGELTRKTLDNGNEQNQCKERYRSLQGDDVVCLQGAALHIQPFASRVVARFHHLSMRSQ